jgi:hypothetical protein
MNRNLARDELAIAAVKNISFGKHRIALGYDQFKVNFQRFRDVDLPGYGVQQVPTLIYVEVRKRG